MHGRIWYWSSSPYPGECPRPRPYSRKYAQAGIIACQFRGLTTDSPHCRVFPVTHLKISYGSAKMCVYAPLPIWMTSSGFYWRFGPSYRYNPGRRSEHRLWDYSTCSIFHCAVVRVDKDVEGTSFAHTPAGVTIPAFPRCEEIFYAGYRSDVKGWGAKLVV